jgi:hypothetical protein
MIMSIKNSSNIIGNRFRDLSVFSRGDSTTAPPRAPCYFLHIASILYVDTRVFLVFILVFCVEWQPLILSHILQSVQVTSPCLPDEEPMIPRQKPGTPRNGFHLQAHYINFTRVSLELRLLMVPLSIFRMILESMWKTEEWQLTG